MNKKPITVNSIPTQVELFGRTIKTTFDTQGLHGQYGVAMPGFNEIVLNNKIKGEDYSAEELKMSYLHEMIHFILIFTNYDPLIRSGEKLDLEQFVELLASGIYQYEKSRKF